MRFWKMHGLGNDYIVIDDRSEGIPEKELSKLAEKLCRRRFSVGADGLLIVRNSTIADFKMRIFNSDGSEAEMCGNGIRCIAKYCYDNEVVRKKEMNVETLAGLRRVEVLEQSGSLADVRVDMGVPSFRREDIPMVGKGECANEPFKIDERELNITCVSIGNPHCITFVSDLESFPVNEIGPRIEKDSTFPKGTNVEFIMVKDEGEINVRTWERGVGETTACGTGACASVAVAHRLGKTGKNVKVNLLGGKLFVRLGSTITLEGSVEKVFEAKMFGDNSIDN
jgi:diaminopimelate epimerase